MRLFLLVPVLFLAACADAPADATDSLGTDDGQSANNEGSSYDGSSGSDDDETQRADRAVAALLNSEPDLVFVGDWDCGEAAASFESISFDKLDGKGVYGAFLHERPAGNGTWTFADGTLLLDGTDGSSSYTNASVSGSTMSLTDDQGLAFTCKNVPVSQ